MPRKSVYSIGDRVFYSIKAMAEYAGINEKTLTARIRKGMPLEEACEKTDLRCTYYSVNQKAESIMQICVEQKKDSGLVRNRLRYGYSIDMALNTPKKVTRQGMPIVVHGVLYNSLADALRKNGLTDKESTIRRYLKQGMNPDAAFSCWNEQNG